MTGPGDRGPEAPYRALVVDDEPIARRSLRALLDAVPWIDCIGEAATGEEAITRLRRDRPDLLFLDVQMPGASGVDVLMRAGVETAVIFTTAHEEYAMLAFDLGAIDYLRKPFGRARLQRALERTRVHLDAARVHAQWTVEAPISERLAEVQATVGPLTRIFVRDRGAVLPVRVDDIVRCEADGDYVAVHAAGRRHLVYVNLGDLATRLDASRFLRVHRSHVVNLDFVTRLVPHDGGRLALTMRDGSVVVASRTGTAALRARDG